MLYQQPHQLYLLFGNIHKKQVVDVDTTTVQLTPNGEYTPHWVEKIGGNQIYIKSESGKIDCFFLVHGERQDVPKILVVYKLL